MAARYLLDTNICIYFMKGLFDLEQKVRTVGEDHCFISEITLAELKFGVENSNRPEQNRVTLEKFLSGIQILPIINTLDVYAKEKSRLQKAGSIIDDFDLLIGAAAITYNLILVTNNSRHFTRLSNLSLENWAN